MKIRIHSGSVWPNVYRQLPSLFWLDTCRFSYTLANSEIQRSMKAIFLRWNIFFIRLINKNMPVTETVLWKWIWSGETLNLKAKCFPYFMISKCISGTSKSQDTSLPLMLAKNSQWMRSRKSSIKTQVFFIHPTSTEAVALEWISPM